MANGQDERKLTAILAADVVGYSGLIEVAHRAEVLDPKITEHHGRIVSPAGDTVLAERSSSSVMLVSRFRLAASMWRRVDFYWEVAMKNVELVKLALTAALVFALSVGGVTVATAGHGDLSYEYLFGKPLFDMTGGPTPFDTKATASNGDVIEIQGKGTLSIRRVDEGLVERSVTGGGKFTHNLSNGDTVSGIWEAKQLLLFDHYGPTPSREWWGRDRGEDDPCCAEEWESGRALILVHLTVDGEQGRSFDAVLEIGCRLPGNNGAPGTIPGVAGTIEGVRLKMEGGPDFNHAADPKATLFIRMN